MAPSAMKAIQIQEFNAPYTVSEVPVPKPKPHQVLMKMGAGGFCHTDLMALNHEFNTTLPYIGSHEASGIVEEVGAQVKGFKKGDRVGALNFDSPCGKCPDCKAGKPLYCDSPLLKGITADGAWAEYMVADADFLVHLPDSINFETAAALMCAGLTIYGSIMTADLPKNGTVAILGIGGLGHIGTQFAKALGYTVLAVDTKQAALDLANSFKHKPDVTMLAKKDSVDSVLDSLKQISPDKYGYEGVDAAILATDHPDSFALAAQLTKKHGKMVLVGQPADGITMSFHSVIFKDIRLVGSLLGSVAQANDMMKLMAKGDITVKIKKWKLEQAEEMRQEYLEGQGIGKNVIVF